MSSKDAIRLPKPIEYLWAMIFGMLGAIHPIVACVLSACLSWPLFAWWNMPLCVKLNCYAAESVWRFMGGQGVERWGRAKYHFYGEKIPMRENAFVTMNHMTLLDWAFLFSIAGRRGRLGVLKFFAKKSVQYVPGFGWGLYLLDSLLVSRNWLADQNLINKTFSNLKKRKLPFWVVSFLEGTRKTPKKLAESQEYSKKKDLPVLRHVLLPRTKGFVATLTQLRTELDAVYDITYAYPKEESAGIVDCAMRRLPGLHFHVRRFPIADLPSDPAELAEWCMQLYVQKDALLETFYTTGTFPDPRPEGEWSLPYKHEYMKIWDIKGGE